jgi:transcriptional antiterminator Rof (Rho-off)
MVEATAASLGTASVVLLIKKVRVIDLMKQGQMALLRVDRWETAPISSISQNSKTTTVPRISTSIRGCLVRM